ncbi:hypothetical protein NDU88_007029 [Pleurodeles waltl]|uniref:Uncharacterized protein n=1 Tax=Pleurodeles waltl TaxID=8319 RepID=A0AAV7NS22_PLEWA|nr:hypothetical protein NDU88_007029 [Pleurodeles waltl]
MPAWPCAEWRRVTGSRKDPTRRNSEPRERLDPVERRVSEAGDEQNTLGAAQKKVDKLLVASQSRSLRGALL